MPVNSRKIIINPRTDFYVTIFLKPAVETVSLLIELYDNVIFN